MVATSAGWRRTPIRILTTSNTLVDDRLLVAVLLGEPVALPSGDRWTTSLWYYRACRAAIAGGAGHLSGPFAELSTTDQATALQAMLELPEDIGLPDPRMLVPEMAAVHQRHPRLNLLNLEAVSAARLLGATVALSAGSAAGILPALLEAESVPVKVVRSR